MTGKKHQVRGLQSDKKRSPDTLCRNEHFWRKRNEEIGVFLQTLFTALRNRLINYFLYFGAYSGVYQFVIG